jgi:hypothetical protein
MKTTEHYPDVCHERDCLLKELERTLIVLTGNDKNPVGALDKGEYLSDRAKRVVAEVEALKGLLRELHDGPSALDLSVDMLTRIEAALDAKGPTR